MLGLRYLRLRVEHFWLEILHLKGLLIKGPILHYYVKSEEFADDTTVYLQGDLENLKKLESGLAVFCKRSNAMINWHKSCAIWFLRKHILRGTHIPLSNGSIKERAPNIWVSKLVSTYLRRLWLHPLSIPFDKSWYIGAQKNCH